MTVGGEKPSLDELAHFGVKGMRWGIRSADQPLHPNYTSRMRSNDRRAHGKRAVERINKHLNDGETRDEALRREDVRNARQRLAAAGALYAGSLLVRHGSVQVSMLAEKNRAAARDSKVGIASAAAPINFVKPRSGVHNITTMK